MSDDDRSTIEWMRIISNQLDIIHEDVKLKANKSDVEKDSLMIHKRIDRSNEKVDKINNKINWASGVGSAILAALGFKDVI